jgi:hypothetical protein
MLRRNFHRVGRAIGPCGAGRPFLICVAIAALVLAACEHNPFHDDGKLNPLLIGRFVLQDDGTLEYTFKDEIICTETTLTYNSVYNGVSSYLSKAGTIEYVYNFNSTSGCLILKYTAGDYIGKYGAMYFSHASRDSVRWGDAYDVEDYTRPTAVNTLEEAKEKFKPENANRYGGADALAATATPLLRQP